MPLEYLNELKKLLDRAIIILGRMVDPPDENWDYLNMGGNRERLIQAVEKQIPVLQERRKVLVNR